ncbi:hypothetical protein FXF51_43395 [Nonomuraea sp. PA05]|uniref:hypothetical protein n=1 Tax=Nonomuraea sp. PA05 TaxID=2604466 RepID=UPI0011D357B1|nr:hypothetical protein [Nonomuraea sp. PA05]TYB56620.1 hypothetical protein FXF51_43395 [Nonomuraea sp. PA05]
MTEMLQRVSRFRSYVSELLARADRALYADQDERARRYGWTVTRTGFGSRRYRDPRFDALKAARLRELRAAGEPSAVGDDRHVPA